MGRLEGKVVIVTGALGGIGRADAALFAREGRETRAHRRERPRRAGVRGRRWAAMRCFSRTTSPARRTGSPWWQAAEQRFGRLDVLVNNAGLMVLGSVVDASYADWRRVHAVNLDGVFLGCKHALPAIERAGGGSIVNISSIAAMQGVPFAAAYSASKARGERADQVGRGALPPEEERRALQLGAPRRREDADGGEGRDRTARMRAAPRSRRSRSTARASASPRTSRTWCCSSPATSRATSTAPRSWSTTPRW